MKDEKLKQHGFDVHYDEGLLEKTGKTVSETVKE